MEKEFVNREEEMEILTNVQLFYCVRMEMLFPLRVQSKQ